MFHRHLKKRMYSAVSGRMFCISQLDSLRRLCYADLLNSCCYLSSSSNTCQEESVEVLNIVVNVSLCHPRLVSK